MMRPVLRSLSILLALTAAAGLRRRRAAIRNP